NLHKRAFVPTFAALEYLQYGSISLRANQRLQTPRAEHRHRRRAIRVFDRRRSKAATSFHNSNDSGAPFKRRPLPPFTDQVREETGKRVAGVGRGSSSRVAESIPLCAHWRMGKGVSQCSFLGVAACTRKSTCPAC